MKPATFAYGPLCPISDVLSMINLGTVRSYGLVIESKARHLSGGEGLDNHAGLFARSSAVARASSRERSRARPSFPALQFSKRRDCCASNLPCGNGPMRRAVSTRLANSTRTTRCAEICKRPSDDWPRLDRGLSIPRVNASDDPLSSQLRNVLRRDSEESSIDILIVLAQTRRGLTVAWLGMEVRASLPGSVRGRPFSSRVSKRPRAL